ncbi:MAG TPA: hypothetical protein VHT73_16200 [Thermodesulfobacteriota bacterium]|nr:hypothetical protein [Thermodesulfobacteriota bacterium]
MTGSIRARSLTLIAAAGCTGVVDACLARVTTVVIANHSTYGATALHGTLLAWPATAIIANYPIRRTAAVAGTSAGIFTTNAAAEPVFRTAFPRLNANLFISTTGVAANFFFPAAESAQAYSVSSTVVKVITLKVAIPCVFTPYYSQSFIIHPFKFLWNN